MTGNHFVVLTDNNTLTYVVTTAKFDTTGQRWALVALGQYSFDIFYRAGLKNADADEMSRYPHNKLNSEECCRLDDGAVRAVFSNEVPAYVTTLPSLNINIGEL